MSTRPQELIKAAIFYFAVVFGAGFILGTLRTVFLVPRVGVRAAELMELPMMVLVSLFAARWTVLRFGVSGQRQARLAVGISALGLLVAAEVTLGILLQGMSVSEYIAGRDPIAGMAYIVALALFAVMPSLAVHREAEDSARSGFITHFIAQPDVAETHEILVRAPADVVFETAEHFDLLSILAVRAIFRLRELVFRVPKRERAHKSLVDETMELGWRIIARRPGRELVMGAVTQPWVGDVKFRGIASEDFSQFNEPAIVKIAWTFEAEPLDQETTRFLTRTRVVATDAIARKRFARYWVFAGPLTGLIRRLANRAIRRESERLYAVRTASAPHRPGGG